MQTFDQTTRAVTDYVPNLLAAVGILIVGTLVALLLAALVKKGLRRTSWDDRIAARIGGGRARFDSADAFGRAVFWLLMIFVFIAALQAIGLTQVTQPLNSFLNKVLAFLPNILGAAVLLAVAWVVARAARWITREGLQRTGIDDRFDTARARASADPSPGYEPQQVRYEEERSTEPAPRRSISGPLGEAVYWLVLLLFLPAVLDVLQLGGLLAPVQNMLDRFLTFLPNLFAAALILLVGWFVARIVRRLVTNILIAVGADRLSERIGLARVLGDLRLSGLVGLVLQVLILIPVLVASLDALQLQAVTQPMSAMLDSILMALPDIFAAALLLLIAWAIARVAAEVVTNLLAGTRLDRPLTRTAAAGGEPGVSVDRSWTVSRVAGRVVLYGILLFAIVQALQLLGFGAVATLTAAFFVFAARVVLALLIFAFGYWLARLAATAIRRSDTRQAGVLAFAAQAAILVLAGAIALREMGVANDIINLGFALLLGAIAVAVALAFGLGAREPAGRLAADWVENWQRGRAGAPGGLRPQPSGD